MTDSEVPSLPTGRLLVIQCDDPTALAETYRSDGAVVVRGPQAAAETAGLRRDVLVAQATADRAVEVRQLLDRLTDRDAALALPAPPSTLRSLASEALRARAEAESRRLDARSGPTFAPARVAHAVDAMREHDDAVASRHRQVHLARGLVIAALGVSLMLGASSLVPTVVAPAPALGVLAVVWWLTRPARRRAAEAEESIERLVTEFSAIDADDLADTIAWQERWRQRDELARDAERTAHAAVTRWKAVVGDREPEALDELLASIPPRDQSLLSAIAEITGDRPISEVIGEADRADELLGGRHRWLAWRAIIVVDEPSTAGDQPAGAASDWSGVLAALVERTEDGPIAVVTAADHPLGAVDETWQERIEVIDRRPPTSTAPGGAVTAGGDRD